MAGPCPPRSTFRHRRRCGGIGGSADFEVRARIFRFSFLSARDRIGGRTYTTTPAPNVHFDVGAGWRHSANTMHSPASHTTSLYCRSHGAGWGQQSGNHRYSKLQRRAFGRALEIFLQPSLGRRAAGHGMCPRARCLRRAAAGIPCSMRSRPTSTAPSWKSSPPRTTRNYLDTVTTGACAEGYGAVVAAFGAPCNVALNTQVTLIRPLRSARENRDTARHNCRRAP